MKTPLCIATSLLLLLTHLQADATAQREWRSTAGTTITALATACDGKVATLKTPDGRELQVPLDKLEQEDRAFLLEHFDLKGAAPPPENGTPAASGAATVEGGLAFPAGEISGPLDAGNGSTCFVYVPTTLREGRLAPSLNASLAGGGSEKVIQPYTPMAERLGWVVVISVESRNAESFEFNHNHAKQSLLFAESKLPMDPDRRYFVGSSGGGAMAWMNCSLLDGAGAMPMVSYIPDEAKPPKKGHFFVIAGSSDTNRYLSCRAAKIYGTDSTIQFYPGGHGSYKEVVTSGIVEAGYAWLHGRWLGKKASKAKDERLDYEAAMIDWINTISADTPHRAFYWTDFLLGKKYKIDGENARLVEALAAKLEEAEPNCRRYVDGLEELDEFGRDLLAPVEGGSLKKHTSPEIQRAAQKIAEKFAGIPEIEELATDAINKTH